MAEVIKSKIMSGAMSMMKDMMSRKKMMSDKEMDASMKKKRKRKMS